MRSLLAAVLAAALVAPSSNAPPPTEAHVHYRIVMAWQRGLADAKADRHEQALHAARILARAVGLMAVAHTVLGDSGGIDWYAVETCEEGPGTTGWATNTETFVGGLGFLRSTWDAFAPRVGLGLAPPPGPDFPYSPAQQIRVADAVVAAIPSAAPIWPGPGCTGYHGW